MKKIALITAVAFLMLVNILQAQVPDSNQGLRAEWMRGALGLLWLPERTFNGNIEKVTIDAFINQIKPLRTVDYVQIGLTSPNIFSPVHMAPNDIIESLWHGDTDANGDPINLCVPRASKPDPFLSYLIALKKAGLKVEVYVNSYNLLARIPEDTQADYPDVSQRWMDYCDTNATVQTFINSQSYHTSATAERRKYMFCYAEFILKEYAIRYGDLISAWCFDSADNIMTDECGDNFNSDKLDDQRIYQAFADAVHSGNLNAAVSFNNSVGDREENPFATATYFDDYTFGHPFGGAGNMTENETLYGYNHHVVQWMHDYAGDAFLDDTRTWNDNVVSHYFPKQSTTSWNAGSTACLTDVQFVEWNSTGLVNGGAITWGTPLVITNLENSGYNLTLQQYAFDQLMLVDADLKVNQWPGKPNWSRQLTYFPDATVGEPYSMTLTEGVDFWDPENVGITDLSFITTDTLPTWLTITKTATGVWTLSGIPTEAVSTEYDFRLRVKDATGGTNRGIKLKVNKITSQTVQIQATANTNYGTNIVAKMYSEVQTAYDRKATFRIAVDVTPTTGTAINSGNTSGSSTTKSWGIGTDDLFVGSDNEWVISIGNISVVDFNANGGNLTLNNVISSFKTVTIVNANSANDAVSFKINGTTYNLGKTASQTEELAFENFANNVVFNSFSIGVGNTSTTNKWSVDGLTVEVDFGQPETTLSTVSSSNDGGLLIYPNPVQNQLMISMPNLLHTSYAIINQLGQNLLKGTLKAGMANVDVSHLKSGVYIIRVSNEFGTYYQKIIKK